jgi:hypothetical protein
MPDASRATVRARTQPYAATIALFPRAFRVPDSPIGVSSDSATWDVYLLDAIFSFSIVIHWDNKSIDRRLF